MEAVVSIEYLSGQVKDLAALVAEKRRIMALVKELEDLEKTYRDNILGALVVSGMKTVNVDGVGSVTATSKDHVEIRDFNKLANAMHRLGAIQGASILQKRVNKSTVVDLVNSGLITYDELGVELVEKQDLTFKKQSQ